MTVSYFYDGLSSWTWLQFTSSASCIYWVGISWLCKEVEKQNNECWKSAFDHEITYVRNLECMELWLPEVTCLMTIGPSVQTLSGKCWCSCSVKWSCHCTGSECMIAMQVPFILILGNDKLFLYLYPFYWPTRSAIVLISIQIREQTVIHSMFAVKVCCYLICTESKSRNGM